MVRIALKYKNVVGTICFGVQVTRRIRTVLCDRFPELAPTLSKVPPIPRLKRPRGSLADAVVQVVVGQMLSGKAAASIFARVQTAAKLANCRTWELPDATLRECGLSRRKVRAIREFSDRLTAQPTLTRRWARLSPDAFVQEVSTLWGMSTWTAAILALFHLAHEDVFPEGDGSLQRAVQIVNKNSGRKAAALDFERASPYRSYLALYLWKALDTEVIKAR